MKSPELTVRVVEGALDRIEVDAADLEVISGPDKGEKHVLGTDSVIVGSAPDCDWVLHDTTVSGKHFEIQLGDKGYIIRDLESTNGVLLGNVPILRAPLVADTKLRVGDTTIRVRSAGGQRTFPLAPPTTFGGVRVVSLKMRAFLATLSQAAASETTVLLEGETGVGKEVAAQTLHELSKRVQRPFVVLDCGACPTALLGAELFGVEKGAFTGADESRPGLLEAADGGTLFLDEIGELPLELQPLLLGAIERRRGRRMGGKTEQSYDVRLIAATNRNLLEEVRRKRFREDLYYRLAVIRLRVPPLRERLEDLPMLIDQLAAEAHVRLAPEAAALMSRHAWPGNVRELRNAVMRMAIDPNASVMSPDFAGAPDDGIFLPDGSMRPLTDARRNATLAFERRYLREVLARSDGNVAKAAELAGVSRQFLSSLTGKHGK